MSVDDELYLTAEDEDAAAEREAAEERLVDAIAACSDRVMALVIRAERKAALRRRDGRRLSTEQVAELRQLHDAVARLAALTQDVATSRLTQEDLERIELSVRAGLLPQPRSVQ